MKKGILFALAGGVALAATSGKKKKKKKSKKGGKLSQCNPLDPPAGKECFFDGERYVLRDVGDTDSYGGDNPKAMPEIANDQIAFSKDFETYRIGATWRIKVLDSFLNIERLDGQLAITKDKSVAAESREKALARFANQYNVQTVDGPVNIKDLPPTDAALEFLDIVDEYIAKFQRRTFD